VFVTAMIAAFVGGALALAATLGLVASQTGAPDSNPANQPIISYGDR
jgi:hypothetical protein